MLSIWAGCSMNSSGIIHASPFHPCFLFVRSPSQGPCCTAQCNFKLKTDKCRNDSDCAREGMCNGVSALCPPSEPKQNFTDCNRRTQVCINGVCFFAVACNRAHLLQGTVLWSGMVSMLNGGECKINLLFNKSIPFIGFSQSDCEGTPNIKKQVTNKKLALQFEKVQFKDFVKIRNMRVCYFLVPSACLGFGFFSVLVK